MLKTLAIIFGIVFITVGIIGFVPTLTPGGFVLGYFHVNVLHNLVHLVSGIVALYVAFTSTAAARAYFQVFGIIYGIVAFLGFFYGSENILGILANNHADTVLHFVIAIVALYLGFGFKNEAGESMVK